MRLRWTPGAAKDLERIADYYRLHAPTVEARLVRSILEAIASLEPYPLLRQQTKTPDVRKLTVQHTVYVVFYRVSRDRVTVLRIRHGAQKPLRF